MHDPALARLALAESITVLQRTDATYDWREAFHAPAAFGNREEEAVPGFAKLFVDQVRGVLEKDVYARLVESIIDVWQAMSVETTFAEAVVVDEATFLATRARTVGLRPFFVLVEAAAGVELTGLEEEEVKTRVALAVALQNDVLGLRRDLEMREGRNYVAVCSRVAGRGLAWGLEKAAVVHNEAEAEAVGAWRRAGEGGKGVVGEMVGFVGRHWGFVAGGMGR
ncbi:hypothetical protein EJ03DRAFT_350038 [Teratosphaeria nubilosa]|uniref:Terpenoid synthase n=1 Tax=Teratosphaeria nubilosa TaxID=161662 RepID=A0A6G1LDP0_9PEZI|nr:hypothetical protein EJ03DRAFT_350038 [Teratosphaeria nubilosa]